MPPCCPPAPRCSTPRPRPPCRSSSRARPARPGNGSSCAGGEPRAGAGNSRRLGHGVLARRAATPSARLLAGREWIQDYERAIDGTPCQVVAEKDLRVVHYPDRILELYPDEPDLRRMGAVSYMGVPLSDLDGTVLGHLAVMDTKPMPEEPFGGAASATCSAWRRVLPSDRRPRRLCPRDAGPSLDARDRDGNHLTRDGSGAGARVDLDHASLPRAA